MMTPVAQSLWCHHTLLSLTMRMYPNHTHTNILATHTHWYHTHPAHIHTIHILFPHTPWKEERQRVCERVRLGIATLPFTLDKPPAHLNPSRERNGTIMTAWQTQNNIHCIHTQVYITSAIPNPLCNMDNSYPQHTLNLGMEYGPLPTPVRNADHS